MTRRVLECIECERMLFRWTFVHEWHKYNTRTSTKSKDAKMLISNVTVNNTSVCKHIWIKKIGDFKKWQEIMFNWTVYKYKRRNWSYDYGLKDVTLHKG